MMEEKFLKKNRKLIIIGIFVCIILIFIKIIHERYWLNIALWQNKIISHEKKDYKNINKFWEVYPGSIHKISEEYTKNATDIQYYSSYNNFDKTKAYGISMVLCKDDYEKFKKEYSGEVRLKYTFENGNMFVKKIDFCKNLKRDMFSSRGEMCLIDLDAINVEGYEIFDFEVNRIKYKNDDGTLSGEGILGDDDNCKIICIYNYEGNIRYDYYMDMLNLEED